MTISQSRTIKEKIIVRGSTEKVFGALTFPAGYRGWWSKDCQIEVVPTRPVRWTCVGHDMDSWIGTSEGQLW